MKFLPESFTKFDHECRISNEALQIIARDIGNKVFNMNLFGVDILV